MGTKRFLFFILCFLYQTLCLNAQEIRISEDINIRNYYSYDLVGKVNDRIILFRDQGFGKEIDVFDEEMIHKVHVDMELENKKAIVYDILNLDTCFQIFYSFSDRDSIYLKSKKYNQKIQLLDSITLISKGRDELKRKFRYVASEDKKKIAFYAPDRDDFMDVTMIQNDSTHTEWNKKFIIEDINVISDLRATEISNDGSLFLLFDINNNRYKKDNHFSQLVVIKEEQSLVTQITYESKITKDLILKFDNKNNRISLIGLYNEKDDFKSDGLFLWNEPLSDLSSDAVVQLIPFTENFVKDVDNKKRQSADGLENFVLSDLVLRKDGGLILFAEMNKVFSRRNPYQGANTQNRDDYVRRGWTDYYNEDVLVMAFDPQKKLEWKTVLYKKQFSQDDEGIYSSFFLFKTPSRIKMLYNDEIKKNNTVSQYNLSPLGESARKSILSTDYQNLKLRFTSALQISSNQLLVPSESAYNLNLVKIEYID